MSRGHRRLAGQERLGEGDRRRSGVGGGWWTASELDLPVVSDKRGEALIDTERFVNAQAEDYYWTLRERFEHGSSALTAPLSWPS